MIRKYAEIFCWKNVSSFCSAKATHIFSAKNIRISCIESAKTVNEMTLNKLVKLTRLWTTGSSTFEMKKWLIWQYVLFESTLFSVLKYFHKITQKGKLIKFLKMKCYKEKFFELILC